jgi:hypothetical protein
MDNVMISDNSNSQITASPIWWDGNNIRFDPIPEGFSSPGNKYQARIPLFKGKKTNQIPAIPK